HRRDPAEAGRVHVAADLVAHLPRGQHRRRPGTPVPGPGMSGDHLPPPTGRVPSTLLMRYLLHHKGLPTGLRWSRKSRQGTAFAIHTHRLTRRHAWSRTSREKAMTTSAHARATKMASEATQSWVGP